MKHFLCLFQTGNEAVEAAAAESIENSSDVTVEDDGLMEHLIECDDKSTDGNVEQIVNTQALVQPKTEFSAAFVPYVETHAQNDGDIDELLRNMVETPIDEDLTIFVAATGIPKPIPVTMEDLIKRQDDVVSGDKAYNENVSYLLLLFLLITYYLLTLIYQGLRWSYLFNWTEAYFDSWSRHQRFQILGQKSRCR